MPSYSYQYIYLTPPYRLFLSCLGKYRSWEGRGIYRRHSQLIVLFTRLFFWCRLHSCCHKGFFSLLNVCTRRFYSDYSPCHNGYFFLNMCVFLSFPFFSGNLALCVAINNSRDTEWRKAKKKSSCIPMGISLMCNRFRMFDKIVR